MVHSNSNASFRFIRTHPAPYPQGIDTKPGGTGSQQTVPGPPPSGPDPPPSGPGPQPMGGKEPPGAASLEAAGPAAERPLGPWAVEGHVG